MIGETYNELTVLEDVERINGKRRLKCICSCGNISIVDAYKLKIGRIKSCGCKRNQYIAKARTKHSGRQSLLYSKWSGIKRRCLNPNDSHYKNYGALGITICDEWKNDFGKFQNWALSNGYDDSLTIERIDINKGYEPSNCEWIPTELQASNKRNTNWIIYKGKRHPISMVAKYENINYKTLKSRYYRFLKRNPQTDVSSITFDMLIPR